VGVLEDRPSRHRDLVLARHTLEQNLPDRPSPTPAAPGTDEPSRPSQPEEIVSTSLLCAKPSFHLSNGAGIIFHGALHYRLGLPESSGYPLILGFGGGVDPFLFRPFRAHCVTPLVPGAYAPG
jgi:hypothetical protein